MAFCTLSIMKGGPDLYHLLFADDVLLFCQEKESQVQLVNKVLDDFCGNLI